MVAVRVQRAYVLALSTGFHIIKAKIIGFSSVEHKSIINARRQIQPAPFHTNNSFIWDFNIYCTFGIDRKIMNINVTHILDDFIRVACLADALSLSPLPLCYHHLPHFICSLNKLITFPIFNALYNFEHVQNLPRWIKWAQQQQQQQ